MGLGLLGTAIAGAAVGGGEIAMKEISAQIELDKQQTLEMARHANNLEMEGRRQEGESARQERGIIAAKENLGTEIASRENLQQGGFVHTEQMAKIRADFKREENTQKATLTREEIASREKMASANNANAMAISKIGGTVTQDKEGNVMWVTKDGKPTQMMDPNTGKPLQGYKDMTPAAKQYTDVIKAQLVGLDKEEVAALDEPSKQKIVERRAVLNKELLNVLTGGIDSASKAPKSAVDPSQFDPNAKKAPAAAPAARSAQEPAAKPGLIQTAAAPSAREFDPVAERSDNELARLKVLVSSKDANVSTNAYIQYAARLKQLRAQT